MNARSLVSAAVALSFAGLLCAQTEAVKPHGDVERVKVHGKSLEGNLEGDSPDREVLVYLPSSYKNSPARRYPVVYMLHGFTDDTDHWWGVQRHFINLPVVLDKAFSDGSTREMILVMPNAYTAYQGSIYSSSVTTGDWETFVAKELVGYIDSHYRTIADVASRGLAGHSMGGYGAIRIGMKYPEIFSSLYVLSPCCMSPPDPLKPNPNWAKAESVRSAAEMARADFGVKAALASAAAWSPNPKKPPLFFDLPTKGGEVQREVVARWAANAPLAMIALYMSNLRRIHALAFDAA